MKGVSWSKEHREQADREGKGLFCIAVDGKNLRRGGMTMHGCCTEAELNAIHEFARKLIEGEQAPVKRKRSKFTRS